MTVTSQVGEKKPFFILLCTPFSCSDLVLEVRVSRCCGVLMKHLDESQPVLCGVVIQTHPLSGEAQTCSEETPNTAGEYLVLLD